MELRITLTVVNEDDAMPEPLDYARPEINVRSLDRAINFASGLQLMVFGLEVAIIFVTWKGSNFGSSTAPTDPWAYSFVIQWPGYGLASACAFAGSLSRFVERRRLLYRIYLIAFPVLVGIAVIGYVGDPKDGKDLTFIVAYPFAALIGNPALVVLVVRKLRGIPQER